VNEYVHVAGIFLIHTFPCFKNLSHVKNSIHVFPEKHVIFEYIYQMIISNCLLLSFLTLIQGENGKKVDFSSEDIGT
jgi:hypothetical protein